LKSFSLSINFEQKDRCKVTIQEEATVVSGTLVTIREKFFSDLESDYKWRRDPELAAFDASTPIRSSFDSYKKMMQSQLDYPEKKRRTYAIEDKRTSRHVGNIMYYDYNPLKNETEIGITIGDREYWSKGFGTETINLFVDYLFNELNLRKIYLHTLVWNYRAQRCFTKAGFVPVNEVQRGAYNFLLMEIIRE
tara:strand:- start:42 stop:620 length:579 start_codon:yes stop_codon:yes gene_type:complete